MFDNILPTLTISPNLVSHALAQTFFRHVDTLSLVYRNAVLGKASFLCC